MTGAPTASADLPDGEAPTPRARVSRRVVVGVAVGVAVLVGGLAVLAASGDSTPSEVRLGGVSLPVPDGWFVREDGARLELVADGGGRSGDTPAGTTVTLDRFDADTDPADALDAIADDGPIEPVAALEEPGSITVDGIPAVEIALEDDAFRRVVIFFVVDEESYVLTFRAAASLFADAAADFVYVTDNIET